MSKLSNFLSSGSAMRDSEPRACNCKSNGCKCNSKQTVASEAVNHPAHYAKDGIDPNYEPYAVIKRWGANFNIGNALKYIARYERKGTPKQDLQKAMKYIEFEIDWLKSSRSNPQKHFMEVTLYHGVNAPDRDLNEISRAAAAWNVLDTDLKNAISFLHMYCHSSDIDGYLDILDFARGRIMSVMVELSDFSNI